MRNTLAPKRSPYPDEIVLSPRDKIWKSLRKLRNNVYYVHNRLFVDTDLPMTEKKKELMAKARDALMMANRHMEAVLGRRL